jgi:hypothetical protein
MILDIILAVILVFCGFIVYRQDKTIKTQIDYIDEIEIKLLNNLKNVSEAYAMLKAADEKGGFESDDEIGEVFKTIKTIIADLEKEINE